MCYANRDAGRTFTRRVANAKHTPPAPIFQLLFEYNTVDGQIFARLHRARICELSAPRPLFQCCPDVRLSFDGQMLGMSLHTNIEIGGGGNTSPVASCRQASLLACTIQNQIVQRFVHPQFDVCPLLADEMARKYLLHLGVRYSTSGYQICASRLSSRRTQQCTGSRLLIDSSQLISPTFRAEVGQIACYGG